MKKILIVNLFILLIMAGETKTQWTPILAVPPGGGITDMVVTPGGNVIVTRGSFNYPNGQLGGISWSSNQGGSWNSPVNVYTARTLELGPAGGGLDIVYASVWNYPSNEALYRTVSGGISWTGPHYSVGANDNIFAIEYVISNTLFIGTRNGVLKSTNSGANFFSVNNGIPPNSWVYDIEFDSSSVIDGTANSVIAAGSSNGLFTSTNLGTNWQQIAGIPETDTIISIRFTGSKLIAGSDDGSIFISQFPYTTSSNSISLTNQSFEEISLYKRVDSTITDERLFFTARPKNLQQSGGGIFLSADGGVTLTAFSQGLPQNPVVSSFVIKTGVSSMQLYAGLYNNTLNGGAIYTRNVLIGIEPISSEVPRGFSLSQNYPNPFNPVTNIEFALPNSSFVKLAVYDLLGREVEALVNKDLKAGTYKVDWDASKYPSGVYYYKLKADNFSATKKMVLIK